jgi:thioredoxin reductase (NADPH)
MTSATALDCLIIGGGPAGLSAATYLSRFHLAVLVVDSGHSRAALIPLARNHPGFPAGIVGVELLKRMREQAAIYGGGYVRDKIVSLRKTPAGFIATSTTATFTSKSVLLATGVSNHKPSMPAEIHDAALARGLLRYCPICDGYEISDRPVAVIGTGERGVNEAEFLRSYSDNVALIAPEAAHLLTPAHKSRVELGQIELFDGPCLGFALLDGTIEVILPGRRLAFASIYPALGSDIHSDLAIEVGAAVTHEGCLEVDGHQRTTIAGLYAAGDVVLGLNQISHAMGEAAVASTAIRNDFARDAPFRR